MTDFNDIHVNSGLSELQRRIQDKINKTTDDAEQKEFANNNELQNNQYCWEQTLDVTEKGAIRPHMSNIAKILRHHEKWSGVLGYCAFSYRVMWRKKPPMMQADEEELVDADIARLRDWLHTEIGMHPPSKTEIQDAIIIVSHENRFHPVRDWLESLRWDGERRIKDWIIRAYNPPEQEEKSDYLSTVGIKFLIGAVARIMKPGCKHDSVLILEGEQGIKKSTSIYELFSGWFSDAPLPIGDKDSYQLIQGVWGYEIAELDAFNNTDTRSLKAFFSQREDRFRPPYGSSVQSFKRQTVFVGSTNQNEYLKDYSGNRRYWPVLCTSIDIDYIRTNREQLFAEALHCYNAGDSWAIVNDAERLLFTEEQEDRLQRDAWEDIVRDWLQSTVMDHLTAAEILSEALGIDAGHIQRVHQNRLAPIMKALGWRKRRKELPDPLRPGKVHKPNVYCRPGT